MLYNIRFGCVRNRTCLYDAFFSIATSLGHESIHRGKFVDSIQPKNGYQQEQKFIIFFPWSQWSLQFSNKPKQSMYGIFTYIWLIFMVNVGHGWYGTFHWRFPGFSSTFLASSASKWIFWIEWHESSAICSSARSSPSSSCSNCGRCWIRGGLKKKTPTKIIPTHMDEKTTKSPPPTHPPVAKTLHPRTPQLPPSRRWLVWKVAIFYRC